MAQSKLHKQQTYNQQHLSGASIMRGYEAFELFERLMVTLKAEGYIVKMSGSESYDPSLKVLEIYDDFEDWIEFKLPGAQCNCLLIFRHVGKISRIVHKTEKNITRIIKNYFE